MKRGSYEHDRELEKQEKAWSSVMKLAQKGGLIANAAGGAAILIHPRIQIEEGSYNRIQKMTGNGHRCV